MAVSAASGALMLGSGVLRTGCSVAFIRVIACFRPVVVFV
ncbi:hypothetical protein ADILRU_2023 [Leifsonia rubra CMS 76R]|nr:hypothetical protein ADILRU_2023 [Leifsonia rubra CMS 76R]